MLTFTVLVQSQTYQVTIMNSITYSFTDSTLTVITNNSNIMQKVKHLPDVQGIEGIWISTEPYAGKLFKYQLVKTTGKDKFMMFIISKDIFTGESVELVNKVRKITN